MNLFGLLGLLITSGCFLCGLYLMITSVKAHYEQDICAHCEYDLRGRSGDSQVCPECGGENTQVEVRIERRPWRMIAGIGVVALGGLGFVTGVYLSRILI